jgi:ADP-ribose pyrophosphatase YjhB (NUDIX family)
LPNVAPVDAAVRELFLKAGLALTVDDLTLLSDNPVRLPLPASHHHLVHVFSASIHVPYVTANLRTSAKVEYPLIDQSVVHLYSTYVVPTTIDKDGLSIMPSKIGPAKETQRKYELLHFRNVA